ncbi:MAG TPA: ABC transporter substrate-binding protein [bacterium]|nr:ABC transporter substrate-binding protein [bacterium]
MSGKICGVLVLAVAVIVGCRSTSSKTTVTFWHAMGGESEKTLKAMVAEFESTHVNIHVELVGMGNYDALSQKLMGAVAAKNTPVIAQMYENWTTQLHAGGELVYLDSFVHGPNGLNAEDLADIYPALLENNTWDGKLLTLPFNKSVPVYYYNVPMFTAAGYPEFPKTWPEFRAAAIKLTKRDAAGNVVTWGAAGGTDIWIFGSMLAQRGGRFLDHEDGGPLFNSKEGVEALQFQVDMVLKDKVQNTDVGRTPMDDFLVGRMATLTGSSTWRATVVDKESFPVGMAPVPTWDKSAAIVYGTNIGMFRRATPQQKAAAWTFIKWFTSPEQQVEWSLGTWYVPIHRRSLDDPRMKERLDKTPGLRAAYAQMDCAVFEPRGLKWLAGRMALVEELEQAMLGAKTPKQALDDAAARYGRGSK